MVKKHSLKIVYIPSACPEDVCGEIPVRESIKDMGNVNLEFATYGVGEWDDRTFEDVDLVVVETVAGRYDTNSTLIDLVRLAEVKANVLLFDFRGSNPNLGLSTFSRMALGTPTMGRFKGTYVKNVA